MSSVRTTSSPTHRSVGWSRGAGSRRWCCGAHPDAGRPPSPGYWPSRPICVRTVVGDVLRGRGPPEDLPVSTDRREVGQGTLLFVDEIHRFNRAQQDSFLPYVEDGTIVLVGATTENPSFELNGALLSRCQVFVLKRLERPCSRRSSISRAEGLNESTAPADREARQALIAMADGDGRYLLNMIEQVQRLPGPVDPAALAAAVQKRAPLYDKSQEGHYNLISALHKSMRGSDPDAALYWLARMLDGGEDPLFIARRITRFAEEDIGMADPNAVQQALAAWDVYERLGSPEGELALAQAVRLSGDRAQVHRRPPRLRTGARGGRRTHRIPHAACAHPQRADRLMKDLGYGRGTSTTPTPIPVSPARTTSPTACHGETFYEPTADGYERTVAERFRRPTLLPFNPDLPYDQKGPAPLQAGDTSWLEADNGFSEDCLNLNVWAPEDAGAEPLPVVVYVFGGGWMLGANTQTTSNAAGLAATGRAIGVSINYRLGAFGWLSLSQYGGALEEATNLGLQDIITALRWVRENIARFGGDADNVTVTGHSAGAFSTLALLAAPSADGLYHHLAAFSGMPSRQVPAWGAEERALAVLTALGIQDDPEQLLNVDAHLLADTMAKTQSADPGAAHGVDNDVIAVVDDRNQPNGVLADHPMRVLESGRHKDVDILFSSTTAENDWWVLHRTEDYDPGTIDELVKEFAHRNRIHAQPRPRDRRRVRHRWPRSSAGSRRVAHQLLLRPAAGPRGARTRRGRRKRTPALHRPRRGSPRRPRHRDVRHRRPETTRRQPGADRSRHLRPRRPSHTRRRKRRPPLGARDDNPHHEGHRQHT